MALLISPYQHGSINVASARMSYAAMAAWRAAISIGAGGGGGA